MKDSDKNCGNCLHSLGDRSICKYCSPDLREMHKSKDARSDANIWIRSKPVKEKNEFAKYRIRRKLTIEDLAELLMLSPNTISRLLGGKPAVLKIAMKVAKLTGIPPVDLIFPAELLEKLGLKRHEVINGIKEQGK